MIHQAIKDLPSNMKLSDPDTFKVLPFPSPLSAMSDRFHTESVDGVYYFHYMGRSKLMELEKEVEKTIFQDRHQDVYLFGPSGSGKSHILAALAVKLIQERKRVIYIPDCLQLLANSEKNLRIALYFAFYDDPVACATIKSAHGIDALLDFIEEKTDKYLLVDQLDVLEPENGAQDDARISKVREWLSRMASDHRYIYSSSASHGGNRYSGLKSRNTTVISFHGGMDEVR
jgi:hypothetical protein